MKNPEEYGIDMDEGVHTNIELSRQDREEVIKELTEDWKQDIPNSITDYDLSKAYYETYVFDYIGYEGEPGEYIAGGLTW